MPAKPKHPAAKKCVILQVENITGEALGNAPAPKQARTHPSLEAWLSHPEHVIRLKQILADPVFVAACHYVEGTVTVTPDDLVGAKAALDEVIVRKTAMAVGVRVFTTTLAALPGFRKQTAPDSPEPWSHIQAPLR